MVTTDEFDCFLVGLPEGRKVVNVEVHGELVMSVERSDDNGLDFNIDPKIIGHVDLNEIIDTAALMLGT